MDVQCKIHPHLFPHILKSFLSLILLGVTLVVLIQHTTLYGTLVAYLPNVPDEISPCCMIFRQQAISMPYTNLLIYNTIYIWHGRCNVSGTETHTGIHNMTIADKRIRQWGFSAFARHCRNIGISFDDCYWMIFGRYPAR